MICKTFLNENQLNQKNIENCLQLFITILKLLEISHLHITVLPIYTSVISLHHFGSRT